MLRVFFTREDLARTQVASAPDTMWELISSLQILRTGDGGPIYDGWRRRVGTDLHRARIAWVVRNLLFPLTPPTAYFPDFLTPAEGVLGLDASLDAITSTPPARVRRELELMMTHLPGTPGRTTPLEVADRPDALEPPVHWPRLADGDRAELDRLARALRSYHRIALAPDWPRIRAGVDADRAVRHRMLLEGGVERVLQSLRPTMRWNYPVLEAEFPHDQELHLEGRGLVLIPTYFCLRTVVPLADPTLPPVLAYPIDHQIPLQDRGFEGSKGSGGAGPERSGAEERLAALLGRTRAAILRALITPSTTTELARRLHVSPASVSQHTAVLRDAGLISSVRSMRSVLHSLAPLGAELLRQNEPR